MRKLKFTAGVKLAAASPDAPQKRRFSILAYTGGPLELYNFDEPVYVDLAGLEAHKQKLPALYDHIPDKSWLAGQLDAVRNNKKQLEVDGFFLKSTQTGREVQAIAEDGYEWQASIGADCEQADIEQIGDGQTAQVNGRTVTGPCYIARKSVLGEVSFVVLGADDRTAARLAAKRKARATRRLKGNAAMGFDDFVKSLGLDPANLTDEQKTNCQEAYDALYPADDGDTETQAEGDGDDVEGSADGEGDDEENPKPDTDAKAKRKGQKLRAKREERQPQREEDQRRSVRASKLAKRRAAEHRRIAAIEAKCKKHPEICAKALEEGWSVEKAELMVLRASRAAAPRPNGGDNGPIIQAAAIEASLLVATGVEEKTVGKWFDQKTMNIACSREMRGIGLHYLMDRVIEAGGDYFRGNRKSNAYIRAALRAERTIRASSGFTTLSLSNILENVANKALIAMYDAQETVWQYFTAVRNLSDFKIASRYRLDMTGGFKKVGPDGELKHAGMGDAKYTNQLDTFGTIISLTRQMMFNDDLDAFLDLPRGLGRMAALKPEEMFFILLLANTGNFFHTNNKNKATGAGSAFSIAGLTAAEQKFRDQVDSNGKPILISPVRILLPSSLKVDGDNIFEEITVNELTVESKPKPARNPHKGKYKPYASPYLNNANITDSDGNAITGQSSTGWYLFADPNVRAAFAMGFLNGQQTPTIESEEMPFDTLGMQWRAYFDVGAGQEDPTAAVLSAGV